MNHRRIIAIAQLTVRDAIRSRLLLALTALILTVIASIPFLITDDASPVDRLSVILRYSLNAVLFILTIGTLWTSCIAISSDIADRRIQLILAKPVHRYELWLGKWLGIVSINLAVLAVSGMLIAGILYQSWNSLPTGSGQQSQTEARLLTARIAILPELPAAFTSQQSLQTGMMLPPRSSLPLHYRLPARAYQSGPYELRYAMESSQPDRLYITGLWTVSDADGRSFSLPFTNAPGAPAHTLIPAFTNTAPIQVTITLTRTDTGNTALLLLAPHGKPPELLVPVGSFEANLCRALLITLFRLAFVAALGVTMGCLLSLPVSVFAAFALLIMLHMGGFISTVAATGVFYEDHHGHEVPMGMLDNATLRLITTLNVVTSPLEQLNALPLLAEARLVPWVMTFRAFGVLAILYSAAVAIPGIWLFNRRELA